MSGGAVAEAVPVKKEMAIEISELIKSYGGFRALNGVNIDIQRGEIHSLVGQNGAGKSTLLGILSGRTAPSEGSVRIFGSELHYGDPRSSRKLGVATIYQELTIAPNLSALENVFLGQLLSVNGFISRKRMTKRYMELCAIMGVNISPLQRAGNMSIADQQMLEIMRGLQLNASILILDEPTASLAPPERKSLLKTIKTLQAGGITIIYVSHHLDEVLELSDSVTILRNGEKIVSQPRAYWTKDKLVSSMLGAEVAEEIVRVTQETQHEDTPPGPELLRATGVSVPGAIEDIAITLHAGEIVGIGGLVGSGRTTLVRALAGLEPKSTGTLWIEGKQVKWPREPGYPMSLGIALAPEDRKHQGLVLGMSCEDNINMVNFGQVKKLGFYRKAKAGHIADGLSKRFGLTRPIQTLCRNLSGGNQQKVLLAKVCNLRPKVLIVDEPTRGIDIGVKVEVLKILRQLANEGMAIVIISSELEEVIAVSNRVLVLSKGRLVKELSQRSEISVDHILQATF
ncbi:sugar ABC transporter ATP-binding protein [Paenibacillus sp. Leaf72]|uniref:sugar ABC transporter ATP-binding protein n=1 Tax=Paenibacillus sp. Leaf72 TaxID=1736234 RepID=UPI0009D68140|nr:sugar ABC transporter ATP-binding protein [Paenibacillus sp. Leaf72]